MLQWHSKTRATVYAKYVQPWPMLNWVDAWPRVRHNSTFQAGLQWWQTFTVAWNGSSIRLNACSQAPDIRIWSDASGKCGCMALWRGSWFQVTLEKYPKAQQWDILAKELLLIILATSVWGITLELLHHAIQLWQCCSSVSNFIKIQH